MINIKKILIVIFIIFNITPAFTQVWVETTKIYTPKDNTAFPFAWWGSSRQNIYAWVGGTLTVPVTNIWPIPFQWGQFQIYDLKPQFDNTIVGSDGLTDRQRFAQAKWMDIGGILLITGAGSLEISFRATGSTSTVPYQEQSLSWSSQGGSRSVSFDTVPLTNGTIEVMFKPKNYPDTGGPFVSNGSSDVGWNLKIKKFGL